ncbi:MAG: hypothetical protein IJI22_03970 [Bacilli bacterium]|nr:hypothetical protein [Bacilli bacterium]
MRNKKISKIILILLTIFFITGFVLSQAIATDYFKNMFWASYAFLIVGILLDVNAWSKLGLDVDKGKAITIRRSFDDNTTLLAVSHGTLTLVILLFDTFNHNVMKNNYVIIGMFIMTLEFELFTYLSIWNAKRDTAKLLKGSK